MRDWRLLDRATSIERQAEWTHNLEGRAEFDGWWRSGWIPIAERLDGDLLVIDPEGTFDAPGSVVEVVHDAPFRYVRAESIDAWLEGLARSLEADEWALYDDGLWWDDPDTRAWERLGATHFDGASTRFPLRVELNVERERVDPRPDAWIDAWRAGVSKAAPEARWAALPFGWGVLRWHAGGDLDETLARLADAPPSRVAVELARLASDLFAAGDERADALFARLLTQPVTALVFAVAPLDMRRASIRKALVAHAIAQAAARVEGAAALCAAVAASVAAHDETAARYLRWWSARLRPTPDTRFVASVMRALAAARSGEPGAAASVDALLADPTSTFDLDALVARQRPRGDAGLRRSARGGARGGDREPGVARDASSDVRRARGR